MTASAPSVGFPLAVVCWAVLAVVVAGLAFFAVIYVQDVTPVGSLTRDPTVTAEEPWYLGAASSLGAIGWAAAAAFFGFAALLVRRAGGVGSTSLALAALYSLLLLVDDVFLLHDDILLRAIGSEIPVYAAYLALGAAWLASGFRLLEPPTALLLVLSTGLLGLSVTIDIAWQSDSDLRLVVEDGAKFIGIWLWALFALAMGTAAIERATARRGV
ncbi:MAG: hypothetical protein WBM50_27970 [Acidimicrobiales bacterium]